VPRAVVISIRVFLADLGRGELFWSGELGGRQAGLDPSL
jgi:hypothetical protein